MSGDYSLSDVLERIYHNQLALEAAVMELTLQVEQQGLTEAGEKFPGSAANDWRKRRPYQTGSGPAQGYSLARNAARRACAVTAIQGHPGNLYDLQRFSSRVHA